MMSWQRTINAQVAVAVIRSGEERMNNNWNECLTEKFKITDVDIRNYSPLTLAYIGDGIYELLIRTVLVSRGNMQTNKLHKRASSLVKAQTQAAMIEYFVKNEILTEEEHTIYKRGRNAFTPTRAKNASMSEYRKATGFEALMGYLYMKNENTRMIDLVALGLDGIGETI